MCGIEVPQGLLAHSVSRNGLPDIFSSYERGFLGYYINIFLYFFLLRERVFGFYCFMFEILLNIFPVLPLRSLCFLKEWDYVEHRSIQGQISLEGGQVLYLAGLITRIGARLRSKHCNILYIAVIALSLC